MTRILLAALSFLIPFGAIAQNEEIMPDSSIVAYSPIDPTPTPVNADAVAEMIRDNLRRLPNRKVQEAQFRLEIDTNGRYVGHTRLEIQSQRLARCAEPHLPSLVFTPALDSGRAVPATLTLQIWAYPVINNDTHTYAIMIIDQWDQAPRTPTGELASRHPRGRVSWMKIPDDALNAAEVLAGIEYPQEYIQWGIVGKVYFRLTVNRRGRCVGVRYSIPHIFYPPITNLAKRQLRHLRFAPQPTGLRRREADVRIDYRIG